MEKPLFRRAALERLSSPEQLDRLMQVTQPVGWLSLLALGFIVLAAIVWGIVGKIPVQAAGQGILLSAGGIHDVVSPRTGLVADVLVNSGDVIQAGQVVATIDEGGGHLHRWPVHMQGASLSLKLTVVARPKEALRL